MIRINDVFAILLLILPGVLTEKIVRFCGSANEEEKQSDFKSTMNGILYSLPIMLFVGAIVDYFEGLDSIPEIFDAFSSIRFVMVFAVMSVTTSIIFGIVIAWFKRKYQNPIRAFVQKKIFRKNILTSEDTCWESFFSSRDSMYLEVIRDGESYFGFHTQFSLNDEEKELILHPIKYLDHYPEEEIRPLFQDVNRIFINFEKNIVIKDYDTTKYIEWLKGKVERENTIP